MNGAKGFKWHRLAKPCNVSAANASREPVLATGSNRRDTVKTVGALSVSALLVGLVAYGATALEGAHSNWTQFGVKFGNEPTSQFVFA